MLVTSTIKVTSTMVSHFNLRKRKGWLIHFNHSIAFWFLSLLSFFLFLMVSLVGLDLYFLNNLTRLCSLWPVVWFGFDSSWCRGLAVI